MKRIAEKHLILPSLFLMDSAANSKITTAQLIVKLTAMFKPTGVDAEILAGRNDTKFSQIVRNLNAHKTFKKYRYATYFKTQHNEGFFEITELGKEYLNKHSELLNYLWNNHFSSEALKTSFERIPITPESQPVLLFAENTTINEGVKSVLKIKIHQRSLKLRNVAIEHYTKNGSIKCRVCCFDFENFYGEYGKGFIEIHHVKPVFMFQETELNKTLVQALTNVIPVCSNCHKMLHRKQDAPLSLDELRSYIAADLIFCE